MKKVAVVGVYGKGTEFTTGQAVKCRVVIDWLKKEYGTDEVVVVNTYKWKKSPIKMLLKTIQSFIICKNIIIMPAQNGIKVFAVISDILNKMFHRKLHYIVIGGWLAEMVAEKKNLKSHLMRFDSIQVETIALLNKLKTIGFSNVYYMPNCRDYSIESYTEPKLNYDQKLKVCTFSRVIKEKGIGDAIEICRKANELLKKNVFELHIYGAIGEEYKEEFKNLISTHKDIVTYCGVANAKDSVRILRNYFALLFPTYYSGEGLAGTILDGFAARIPIIANDWKYNSEIIKDGENGFIYHYRDTNEAAQKLLTLYNDSKERKTIVEGCTESLKKYSTKKIMGEFSKILD
mgnify:FL=1